MAVHGVTRGTLDVDLLTLATDCLSAATWEPLRRDGIEVEIRRGDPDDPLAGIVRFGTPATTPTIDLVIGKSAWQAGIVERAVETTIEGVRVPVARAADLILLKLYAGGPLDRWDVEQLLAGAGRAALIAEVGDRIGSLPPDCRRAWQRITGAAPT
jgi:hypothetical protein